MARRRKAEGHVNHERWLVSYADFITLLFAFFVVMFATAQGDHTKAARVSESVRKALEEGQMSSAIAGILGANNKAVGKGAGNAAGNAAAGNRKAAPSPVSPATLAGALESLEQVLKNEIDQGHIQIVMQHRGLVISLREAAFFASGDDAVYPGAHASVERIAQSIQQLPNPVRLEGHTDALPIHNSRFRSNWELSAARGIAMLGLLQACGISPERMAVVGYADTAPVESNESEEGRAHNRRVDIVVLNETGALPEPAKVPAATSAQKQSKP